MKAARALALSLVATAAASADYVTDFESPPFNASPAGVVLSGQDGWYMPVVTGSIPYNAMTYAGNAYGIPQNPEGGAQFATGRAIGGAANNFCRAQHDFDFSTSQTWCFSFDFACNFNGIAPATHNLASFSLQPGATTTPTNRIFIILNTFTGDLNVPTTWGSGYVVHNAAGTQVAQPGTYPGPEWQNLAFNTWYRQTTEVNMTENRITRVSITNLVTGATAAVEPVGWYLGGGATPTIPLATSFRVFTGGTTEGNIAAWDNLSIVPTCGGNECPADLDGSGNISLQDLAILLANFGRTDNPPANVGNLDGDGDVDLQDLATMLAVFGTSC